MQQSSSNSHELLLVSVEVVQKGRPLDAHALCLLHLLLPVHPEKRVIEKRDRKKVVQDLELPRLQHRCAVHVRDGCVHAVVRACHALVACDEDHARGLQASPSWRCLFYFSKSGAGERGWGKGGLLSSKSHCFPVVSNTVMLSIY